MLHNLKKLKVNFIKLNQYKLSECPKLQKKYSQHNIPFGEQSKQTLSISFLLKREE